MFDWDLCYARAWWWCNLGSVKQTRSAVAVCDSVLYNRPEALNSQPHWNELAGKLRTVAMVSVWFHGVAVVSPLHPTSRVVE